MFFRSSSPLRTEADHWFLSTLRGRYDVVLKYVARHPGCSNGDLKGYIRSVNPQAGEQVGGYLKILIDKYRMIERRLPIFAGRRAKRGRYYLRDNFLRSWLSGLASAVGAVNFRPQDVLVGQADERLHEAEGFSLERLAAQLYEERSRAGVGDFALTNRIEGYWDRGDTEIDLVALNEEDRRIRFGSCKRSSTKLVSDVPRLEAHSQRFLDTHRRYQDWRIEYVAIAPVIDKATRATIRAKGCVPQDLPELLADLP